MQSNAQTVEAYLEELPADRKTAMSKLRQVILENLPEGFEEGMSYGMLGYAVPHSLYPAGYHCDPTKPLPFISLASQKGHIALHHMGLYLEGGLLDWFRERWGQSTTQKLDMGKGCVRFKKLDQIPFDLIGELASKLTPEEWIARFEQARQRK